MKSISFMPGSTLLYEIRYYETNLYTLFAGGLLVSPTGFFPIE